MIVVRCDRCRVEPPESGAGCEVFTLVVRYGGHTNPTHEETPLHLCGVCLGRFRTFMAGG